MTARLSTEGRRIRRRSAVLSQQLDDEVVLMDPASGQYYTLNEVGRRIWELAAGTPTLGEIHRQLLDEYQVDGEVLWRDLVKLVDHLEAEGLASVEGQDASQAP